MCSLNFLLKQLCKILYLYVHQCLTVSELWKLLYSRDEVSAPSSLMTLKNTLSGVINISLIRRINYRCAKWRDWNAIRRSCLPPTRLLRRSPLAGTRWALLFFSVPQHQNSLLVLAHMRTKGHRQPSDMHAGTHTLAKTQYLLWVVTDWVNAAINGPVYNVSIQNGGLREKQVLSQSVGRGKRCNSLLLLLAHWESSASFLHNLCPLWPRRNWGTLPFHIYPFLYKPPHGLFPGLPPLIPSFEKLCHISFLAFI